MHQPPTRDENPRTSALAPIFARLARARPSALLTAAFIWAAGILAGLDAGASRAAAAEGVVVFNEIMYHPATNENDGEWVELHNPMAVDIDLSAWFITGGIRFTFGEGTIVPGGGYLVVARNPAALQAATGLTSLLGPFIGRLDNSGERLELRDRNNRLMDEVDYRDGGKWPPASDGSGASLAKRDPSMPSDAPERWTSSVLVGGTPGRRNFPDPFAPSRTRSLVAFDALWRYEASGTDLGTDWRGPGYDDSAWSGRNSATLVSYWPFDGNATAVVGTDGAEVGAVTPTRDRNGVAGGALGFSGSGQQSVQVPGGGGLNGASAGTVSLWVKWTGSQDADCCGSYGAVLSRQSNGQFSDDILALSSPSLSSARVVWKQSGASSVLITGASAVGTNWHHVAVTFSPDGSTLFVDGVAQGTGHGSALNNNAGVPLAIGAWIGDGGGFATCSLDDVAVWNFPLTAAQVAQLAAQTATPLDFAAPERAVYYAGDGRLAAQDELRHTQLPLGPTTYYFRNPFLFDDDPALTTLKLDLAVNDGVVVYLNGQEAYRQNMPAGAVSYPTLAAEAVGVAPVTSAIVLPATNLLGGANVLAVEVHQAASPDTDMVFGAGLTSITSPQGPQEFPPDDLVFNEVGAGDGGPFQLEFFNRGAQALAVGGFTVVSTGSPDRPQALPEQTLEPGGFLALIPTVQGFGATAGDKLFLLRPGGGAVADAVEVASQLRGRWPDGLGVWMFPSGPTFGASNSFAFHDELVINEIMYHHPPTLEVPATLATNVLIPITNLWKYDQSGKNLADAWRQPGYDDRYWPSGAGLLYVSTATLPAPKNTPLTLGPTNYYFRTTFQASGDAPVVALRLRHVVDDGAVFYLNGVEVLRYNMPTGAVAHTTFASASIGNPVFVGPVSITLSNLVPGTNVLAVEVHQAATAGNDIVFGAELAATLELSPRVPYQESTEEWVELFNRSSNSVDLTGWRLDEGIAYRFAAGTTIGPGGFLVVARDPAGLQAQYPAIAVVGPHTNTLSHNGELIVLKDASNNPADAVHYFDNGRWPEAADGGGSSLELRNPFADHAAAEAWAASDESGKSSWQTYTYRGIAQASAVGPDGQWKEFVMGFLDRGEVLLDDISVIESPATNPVQLIQNGSFTSGADHWRLLGTHRHSEVVDDPDEPGNKVLRLVATGGTEHMSNHAETTLANGRDVVNGREYQISFRAKWVSGSRQLLTRLYFNRLARTTLLAAPESRGTPGARNSTYVPNLGPTYREFRHDPAVPAPFEPVTVSVVTADPDGVASVTLWSSVNGGAWASAAMADQGGGRYTALLPGRGAGTIVQFYVAGADSLGATSSFPSAGTNSGALYKVDDGLSAVNGLHNLRLILSPANAGFLHDNLNAMSNDKLPATVIYDEREVIYDAGVRLKGSEHSRTVAARLGFDVILPSEHPLRGVYRELGIDRSESTGFGQREMLIHQVANHAGGLPTKYHDLIQVMPPLLDHTGSAEMQLARYSDLFLDAQFPNGSDGMLFEYELIYQLNSTDNGLPEGNKVPYPDSVMGTAIRNMGADKEPYRWTFLIKNNEDRDDYSRLIGFCQAMDLTGTNFNGQIGNYIDIDQWLRGFALCVLAGVGDNYGGDGAQHNVQFYIRPDDLRVMFFPHDLDAFFDAGRPVVGNNDLSKLIAMPARARSYYGQLREIIASTYNTTYMARWADRYGSLLPAQDFAGHLAFIGQRSSFISSQLNSLAPNVAFAITSNNGLDFLVTSNSTPIRGNAATDVKDIYLGGDPAPLAVTWLTTTSWQTAVPIPLQLGTNLLVFSALDRQGKPAGSDSITVVSTVPGAGLDTDGDGMPDAWELANGLDPTLADDMEDPDQDGLTNYQEYLAGTDPQDPLSALTLAASLGTNATVGLTFTAVAGRSYTVQFGDQPGGGSWLRLTNATARLTNRVVQAVAPMPPGLPQQFYRLLTPQAP